MKVGPHPGCCPSKAPLSLPAAWASLSLALCCVSRNHPSPWHFTPCSVGRALTRGSEGPGAAGVSCVGGLVMRTPGIAHGFLSWAASQELRSAGTWSFLLPRAPSSSRGGVVLGKALPRRVPAQPLTHGPRRPQHGQLGAQHQQVSVVSQWAAMGGARGGGGSCRFSVSLALRIVPPTPNQSRKCGDMRRPA